MKSLLAVSALALASAADFLPRNLQSVPPPPPPPTPTPTPPPAPAYTTTTKNLPFYGSNVTIPFNAKLGCGACITGGYTYCVQGSAWSDYSGKAISQTCCQTATSASCPQMTTAGWTCSSSYSDKILAKSICPYTVGACGSKNKYQYLTWGYGQSNSFNINLAPGDTCAYVVNVQAGLPAYQFLTSTKGFHIESIDYLDTDINGRRML